MKLKEEIHNGVQVLICTCCNKIYNELPFCFGANYPDAYFIVAEKERKERIELEESLCIIDKEHFFHRGRLTLPILDREEKFIFNVWTTISADNFAQRMDDWDMESRVDREPYFGWLNTSLPIYTDTINLKTIAYEQKVGVIPEIEVIDENSVLYSDQQYGISWEKALRMTESILGPCEK